MAASSPASPPAPPSPPPPLLSGATPADLRRLFALFQAGRHAEMAAAAQALTVAHPGDGQAWKAWGTALLVQGQDALATLQRAASLLPGDAELLANLGGVFSARGQFERAVDCQRQALRLQPGSAQAHNNLGDGLCQLGHFAQAEAACREALRLQPRLAAAQVNLGNALKGQGRLVDAAAAYQLALALNPAQVEAHRNLGRTLQALGQPAPAAASLRQALALQPGHAVTQAELGLALLASGQPETALASLQQAVRLQPDLAAAHGHLGNLLADLGRPADAVDSLRQSLALQPAQAGLRSNLGVALLALGRADEAVAELRQAVQQQPDLALAHSNLGNALLAAGSVHAALASHHRAVALAPELALVHANLGHALKAAGRPGEALAALQQALARAPDQLALHSALLFTQQYLADVDPAERLADVRRFGAAAVAQAGALPAAAPPGPPDKCLRLGLLSADLREHPVGYFSESVLSALAAQAAGRIECFVYATRPGADALSQRLQACARGWRDVDGLDDAALARQIRADAIDVLVDLSGHTLHNRLPVLAWRPAPVQLSWLGYCASTGLDAVDAVLVDRWIAPPGAEAQFTEPLLRLPDSFLCFTPPSGSPAPPVAPLPALSGAGLRFACFNQLAKMNDAVVALWARVLKAVPGSVLVLQAPPLQDPAVRAEVQQRYRRHGIGADRLQLLPAQPRADYLAAYGQVDIALDPFPYPGGTTTAEALWMGVPVLSLPGATALSRQGASLLYSVGLGDWVAADEDDYVARAVRFAADLPALAVLRQGLRQQLLQSPLCAAPRFAQHLEDALRGLWRDACRRAR